MNRCKTCDARLDRRSVTGLCARCYRDQPLFLRALPPAETLSDAHLAQLLDLFADLPACRVARALERASAELRETLIRVSSAAAEDALSGGEP